MCVCVCMFCPISPYRGIQYTHKLLSLGSLTEMALGRCAAPAGTDLDRRDHDQIR